MLAVLKSEDLVRRLAPDLEATTRLPVGGLIVTARSHAGGVESRYYAPAYGIPEDPVTGSTHCTIARRARPPRSSPSRRPRGGALTVATKALRVLLSGTARTAVTGVIH